MSYKAITDRSSKQWKLQKKSKTNQEGFRVYNNRIVIAIANQEVGDELDIELESGEILHAVVGDIKANTNCLHNDNSLIEFIVDMNVLSPRLASLGNLNEVYKGNIKKLYRKV